MITGVLIASLVGSIHCVAMCGPLLGMNRGTSSLRLAASHGVGRLTTYVALGIAAGAIGGAVDLAGHLAAVQRSATVIAGALILGWGLWALAAAFGWRRRPSTSSDAASTGGHGARGTSAPVFSRALVHIRTRRPSRRAWLYGVLTGLLPCGWLWAFVVTAGGTASWWRGGLVMAAFWLGTMPAMLGVLAFGGPLLARLRTRLPAITACVLIALGMITLAARWRDAGVGGATAPHCHHVAGAS
jgi:sulfite exporter TauE/SafE